MAFVIDKIIGKYVDLKSIDVEDAEFTLQIRQDPIFVKYLPRVNNTLEQQKQWIVRQREKSDDYFFVVLNKSGDRIGTIGVYGLETDHPESGRLALKGDAYENFEATLLLYEFAFNTLNIQVLFGFVYKENKRANRFNAQFGVRVISEYLDECGREMIGVRITKEDFNCFKPGIEKKIRLI